MKHKRVVFPLLLAVKVLSYTGYLVPASRRAEFFLQVFMTDFHSFRRGKYQVIRSFLPRGGVWKVFHSCFCQLANRFSFLLLLPRSDKDCQRRVQKLLFNLYAFDANLFLNSWTLLFVTVPCFRHPGLPIIKKEQGYCRNSEIAVLRGAVGQYNVIHTLPYESVSPMHKSAYVVECP